MQYAPENVEDHVGAHTGHTQTRLGHSQSAFLRHGGNGQVEPRGGL